MADKKKIVTAKTAKAMREDRQAGMTIRALMVKYDVSAHTVARHTSEASAEAIRKYERDRYERVKADPVKREAHRKRNREYYRRRAALEPKNPPHRIPNAIRKKIKAAVDAGVPVMTIAKTYGVSHWAVMKHGRGIDPRDARRPE